jgi:soluble lytic murein transglycosylase
MRFLILSCVLLLPAILDAASLADRRGAFRAALETAERGPPSEYAKAAAPFGDHPLAVYLEYAHLRRQLDRATPATVDSFLRRRADTPLATPLREAWLHALIRRKEWSVYRTFYVAHDDPTLRCGSLHARLVRGMDAGFVDDALALWSSGKSLPALCDMSFLALKAAGKLTPAALWNRIDLAAEAGNLPLIRFLAASLPTSERARAESYASFLEAPSQALTTSWPRDARSRTIATLGLRAMADDDPAGTEALFAALATPLQLDAAQRGEVLNQIALWSAASYLPEAAARFARVPATAFDERLHEWRVREALARNDDAAAAKALAAMGATQRADPRWRYVDARLAERGGRRDAARTAFASLAQEPNYHGFLAADRLGQPYALCPRDPVADATSREAVDRHPGLVRAFELHAIQREAWARREWDAAMKTLAPAQRRIAVAKADDAGWYDRAVFTLNSGEDLTYYRLRFPLPHARALRAEAKRYGLDPGWVSALIRAESAWQADARSHANARGLMQLLPGTARDEARRRGMPWNGDGALYRPDTNLALGTAHLETMLQQHGGKPFLATAAYNAGPRPVARWLAQRPITDPDLWIETIPYRETREYVARILAFSVIYDWRLHGKAVPVSHRMVGNTGPRVARREFVCPVSAAVADRGP